MLNWSSQFWFVIEEIARQVSIEKEPDEEKVICIIYGLGSYLPCEKCKIHFKNYIKTNPLKVKNINKWVKDLKENTKTPSKKVNKEFSKKVGCCGRKPVFINHKNSNSKKIQALRNI